MEKGVERPVSCTLIWGRGLPDTLLTDIQSSPRASYYFSDINKQTRCLSEHDVSDSNTQTAGIKVRHRNDPFNPWMDAKGTRAGHYIKRPPPPFVSPPITLYLFSFLIPLASLTWTLPENKGYQLHTDASEPVRRRCSRVCSRFQRSSPDTAAVCAYKQLLTAIKLQ